MLEKIAPNFILYLALFRPAMIAAATVSIYLGYKLFVRGVWPQGDKGSDLEFKGHDMHFTAKNVVPGGVFAFCGLLMLGLMFFNGGPELTLETMQNAALAEADSLQARKKLRLEMRGNQADANLISGAGHDNLQKIIQAGIDAEKSKNIALAMNKYDEAIAETRVALNQRAWLLHEQGRHEEALSFALVAVAVLPEGADLLLFS